jgi:quinone-modifying oxidoreductase subunit QmoA
MAYPQRYVIDPSIVGTPEGEKAKAACKVGAVDLEMKEETVEIKVGAVIWATGWKPYDAAKIQPYGYDRFANVITSLEFERLADPHGPTGGKILRPSDGKEAKDIAFIQCAGSRDENHLRHCSRICCMASLKQTQYVREAWGDAGKSTVYYIDIRVIDRLEDFYAMVWKDPTVSFVKSKVAKIVEDKDANPVLHGVDTEGYHRYATTHDLVVLAVGMEPEANGITLPDDMLLDSSGFIDGCKGADEGMFGAGAASSPLDVNRSVQSATAAALRAIKVIHQTARTEKV